MIRNTILIYVLMVSTFVAFGQKDQGYLEVKGTVKVDREALQDAKINIYKNGEKDKVFSTDGEGKFTARLDLNQVYELIFTKQDFFSKKLTFTTNVPPEDVGIWNYKFVIELIPAIEGFDASLFDEPIGKFEFNSKVGDFDYDLVYTENMQRRIKALMRDYEKARKEAFDKIIVQADVAFNQKDYDFAMELYDKAIDLDPYDPYPDEQMYMIQRIIQDDENLANNYEKNVKEADKFYASSDYLNAQKYYNRALKYLDKQYPKDQLALIEQKLNENAADPNAKAYIAAIAAAERALTAKQYQVSLEKFTEASGIKPNEQYPKDKIAEINALLAQLDNEKKSKEELEKAYAAAIVTADAGFKQKDYINARSNYVKANQLKPAETYPKTKITEIDNLLAASKSLDEKYKGFIAVADQSFNSKQYESAKNYYQQALSIKPNEPYPTNKITEIDALLKQLADNRLKDLEASYSKAIAAADAAFNTKNYETAKTNYNQALTIKSNEIYPKQRIAEIDKLLTDIATKKRAYDLAIARADNNFNIEKWNDAKIAYQEALQLFPTEPYPQTRINEIDTKLLAMKNAEEQKVAREKAYLEAIAKADASFNAKSYQESKNFYLQATNLKSNETYPKKRVEEIDVILATEKALNDRYNAIIATADQHLMNEKLDEAKATYVNALQLKPNEAYPKQKIAEIDAKLAVIFAAKQKQDQLKKQYDDLIAQADLQFNAKLWDQAKGLYQQALVVLPDEVYPKQKITEIDNLIAGIADANRKYQEAIKNGDVKLTAKLYGDALAAYNQAIQIKPTEVYPKQKVEEINIILEGLKKDEVDYANFIKLADVALTNKQYETAKVQYQSASGIKPNEAYPKTKIAEIDKILAEQLRLRNEKDKLDAQYNQLIANADVQLSQKKYNEAKNSYTQASLLKPEQTYPKEKLSDIDDILETLAAMQKAYDQKILDGAALLASKNYNGALSAYQQAMELKPEQPEPKLKIAEIQKLMGDLAQKQQQYQQLIAQADNSFNQKNYQQAKPVYQQALMLMPNETYPKTQISLIDQLLAEAAKREADLQAKIKAYQAKVAEADKLLAAKDYQNALGAYSNAKALKPDETYPDQQIALINNLIKADAAKLEASFNQAILKGDQLKAQKSYLEAKEQYLLAQNLKPKDPVPPSKLAELQNLMDQDRLAKEKLDKLNADYNNYIVQADNAFKLNEFSSAIVHYKSAQGIKPSEKYPKDQIEICERKIQELKALAAAEEEKRRKDELAASQKSFDKKDFDYSGERRDDKFLNDLAKLYPEGVTTENYDKPNKKIKRVIVNHGGIAKEYIEVTYSYGTYYFRNGQNISRSIFYSETK